MEIEIRKHHFLLLPQKAVFWKEKKTLLIADLHLGKITHFRKSGIAAPSSAYEDNFKRLDILVNTTAAERIIFLGDFFHNRYNREWERFVEWKKGFESLEIIIVLGNHDILPKKLLLENNLGIHNSLKEDGFLFMHHPVDDPETDFFIFCGHVHPVYCLRSGAKQSVRLPCFVYDEHQMMLPAFGVFTGGYEVEDLKGRRIYVVVRDFVMEV